MAGLIDGANDAPEAKLVRLKKQKAFVENFKALSPDDRREFLADQLSQGNSDLDVGLQHPSPAKWDDKEQEPVMDMVRRERAKAQAKLREPT